MTTDICANRHGGDAESKAAFKRVDTVTDRKVVLSCIIFKGEEGATLDEIAQALGRSPNQISGRISELKALGQIGANGLTRKTRTGSPAKVYIKTAKAA